MKQYSITHQSWIRKLILLLFTLTIFSHVGSTKFLATEEASPTATAKSTPTEDKTRQIEELKDRLATKVAELAQTQRRAIFGTVKDTSISSATIETATKDIKIELIDEITVIQYLKGVRTKLTVEDLDKGDSVVVFGLHDATLDLLKATIILIQSPVPTRVSGAITEIDQEENTLTLKNREGQSYVIDIERSTKTTMWDKENGSSKGGFSRVAVGDTIHVIGTPVIKAENRISSQRILDLGNLTGAVPTPEKNTPTTTVTPSPTP